MSQPTSTSLGPLGEISIGDRAARTLTAELARHSGPKSAVLVGAAADSLVLAEALDALQPGDRLTVVSADHTLTEQVATMGSFVRERVKVVADLADAEPADFVIVAEPLVGSGEEARSTVDQLSKLVAEGGLLVVAAVALPGLSEGATEALDRLAARQGVGSDLVLRNMPPVRVHRLRFTEADPAVAASLMPAFRPSSVPLAGSMNIDSNGVAAAGIMLGAAAVLRLVRPRSKAWLVPLVGALPVAAFFRDPEREIPADPTAVVAASDGKVLSVEHVRDVRFGDEEFLRVAVFLSVLDVHVNRAPVAGKVVDYFVEDGGYAAAMKPEAEHNVAAYTVLETPSHDKVVVAQRTGLIARRIVQRAPIGALLARGERFGLIRFGSRTDVYLPADKAEAVVVPGDRVVGGSTVIARWL
ncbi:phosphatidylserine decarboxylase [Allorhizocola rhizosphaerae]|uniref:phosphatidylserine decarboxylase n=1 Tax=Allorhizocola rhizosphaerae TaxID=1872709 RepID=UPI000E3B8BBE|nr:phosphatidylserine decarboxylase [Allorhizocola rhizosphaerae]